MMNARGKSDSSKVPVFKNARKEAPDVERSQSNRRDPDDEVRRVADFIVS
jgi:hypothetical protein